MLIFLLSLSDESNASKIEYTYNRFHTEMLKFALNRLRNYSDPNYQIDAEDVVQNAFVKIVKYIDAINFNASEKEIKAYILTIVANEVSNILSEIRYSDELDDSILIDESEFFSSLHVKERYDSVIKAIGMLDEKYSLTLLYHYYNDMSVKDISDFMGISQKTVYTRLARGKKLLLDILGEKNDT